ncbi:hypothetical protein PHYPO_G00229040 [Pangasianodon hypophthalmus]|uniref:SH2 domain-containing protein n=1 Tax=Pangasianodon hypophthalmus TaxID=310915 RepID=A0A5N5NI36_PANHP|nr:hypothetical protein PHYPO_G00229040 [Pangasianodon hypophthalmus]
MRRAQRTKYQLPPCYYQGFLEKRSFKDKVGRRLWAALCGNALFFYNDSKDNHYVEKQDLSTFISLTDDFTLDRKLDSARLHLRLKDDDIYLTAPSLEARELWKGFILSVAKLEVPTSLNLLPGQIHMLKEAVEKETERRKDIAEKDAVPKTEPDNYVSLQPEMPVCFHRVFRDDAETLLEKHKGKGNLLLRPSRDGNSFAVTTRQDFNGSVFRHYRVTRIPEGGFAIAIDKPIPCPTLHDVINYLMEKTGGVFKPLILEQTYEKNIEYVEDNKENGEKNVRYASSSPVPHKKPPKPVPRQKYQKNESIYLNSSDEEEDPVDESPAIPPRAPVKPLVQQTSMPDLLIGPNGALLPPARYQHHASLTSEPNPKPPGPPGRAAESLSDSLNEELKQKLKMRLVSD